MKKFTIKWTSEEDFSSEDMGLEEGDPDPTDEEAEKWWRKNGPLGGGEMIDWGIK